MSGPTVKRIVHLGSGRRGSKKVFQGRAEEPVELPNAVPRMARLMAFAIVFEEWLAQGKVRDYAELAQITGFDRSRITRIMNLRLLEPREQEALIGDFREI